jgi:hypothetical protein
MNPNPQHNPTDGLGVAAYITLSGTSGSSIIHNSSGGANKTDGANGQGIGPGTAASGTKPVPVFADSERCCCWWVRIVSRGDGAAERCCKQCVHPSRQHCCEVLQQPVCWVPAWYNPSNFAGYYADVASVTEVFVSAGNEVFDYCSGTLVRRSLSVSSRRSITRTAIRRIQAIRVT